MNGSNQLTQTTRAKPRPPRDQPVSPPAPGEAHEPGGLLPTTFQLAQLAALLATQPQAAKIPPAEVALEALQLWDAAEAVLAERVKEAEFTT